MKIELSDDEVNVISLALDIGVKHMTTETRPAVYVGTYAKYNNGSIYGKWINLDDHDEESFHAACVALHSDEVDPELMFQDYQGFPDSFYSESSIHPDVWEWIDMDDDDKELLEVYQDHVDANGTIDAARDAFHGVTSTAEDFAAQFLEDSGQMDEIPENLRHYFDYDAYTRDMEYNGWSFAPVGNAIFVFAP